jgi:5,6-dimethylbenzimidazole synthase
VADDAETLRTAIETLLVWRRDVRHFQRDPLPEAEMERLFALAQLAPSVGNAQPWRFVRIRDADLRETIAMWMRRRARRVRCMTGRVERRSTPR